MDLAIFAGSANLRLAESVAETLGVKVGRCLIARFPDGELHVELEETVRGLDVYLIQPTGPPLDQSLMEILFLADACRRAGAREVTAVTPYFGYARQDRRAKGREAVGARLVADLLKAAGLNRVVAVDLHSSSLEGVFGFPLEHLTAVDLLSNAISSKLPGAGVVVAPDLGAAKLAERYTRLLHLPMAVVHKIRVSAETVEARSVIGEVRGRLPIIVDDMISTAGTIQAALKVLIANGSAPNAIVAASHGLFVGPAVERMGNMPIDRLLVTDSLRIRSLPSPVEVVSIAPMLAEVVSRLHVGESLGDLIAHS